MCGHLHLNDYPTTLLNTCPLVLFNSVEPVLANMEQMISIKTNMVMVVTMKPTPDTTKKNEISNHEKYA